MWHRELGKSTFDIWEEEEREKRINAYRRRKQLEAIATGLSNLVEVRRQADDVEAAVEDMIEEGGPVADGDETVQHDPYAEARKLLRRHMATSAFLGIDPSLRSCDGPPPPVPRERPRPTNAPTDADRQYSEDVTAIALGKEPYGYRNR